MENQESSVHSTCRSLSHSSSPTSSYSISRSSAGSRSRSSSYSIPHSPALSATRPSPSVSRSPIPPSVSHSTPELKSSSIQVPNHATTNTRQHSAIPHDKMQVLGNAGIHKFRRVSCHSKPRFQSVRDWPMHQIDHHTGDMRGSNGAAKGDNGIIEISDTSDNEDAESGRDGNGTAGGNSQKSVPATGRVGGARGGETENSTKRPQKLYEVWGYRSHVELHRNKADIQRMPPLHKPRHNTTIRSSSNPPAAFETRRNHKEPYKMRHPRIRCVVKSCSASPSIPEYYKHLRTHGPIKRFGDVVPEKFSWGPCIVKDSPVQVFPTFEHYRQHMEALGAIFDHFPKLIRWSPCSIPGCMRHKENFPGFSTYEDYRKHMESHGAVFDEHLLLAGWGPCDINDCQSHKKQFATFEEYRQHMETHGAVFERFRLAGWGPCILGNCPLHTTRFSSFESYHRQMKDRHGAALDEKMQLYLQCTRQGCWRFGPRLYDFNDYHRHMTKAHGGLFEEPKVMEYERLNT